MNRKRLESLLWKYTHPDFKGKREDGTRCVNHFVSAHGTCSVPISSLSDEEIVAKLPKAGREELDADRAYQAIRAEAVRVGWPKTFRTDLTTHDKAACLAHKPSEPFAWVLREASTHMAFIGQRDANGPVARRLGRMIDDCFRDSESRFYVWDGVALTEYASASTMDDRVLELEEAARHERASA